MYTEEELNKTIEECAQEIDRRNNYDKNLRAKCIELIKAYCKENGKEKLLFDPSSCQPGCTVSLRHSTEPGTINAVKIDESVKDDPLWNPGLSFDIDTEYDSHTDIFEWNCYDICWADLLTCIIEAILDPFEEDEDDD